MQSAQREGSTFTVEVAKTSVNGLRMLIDDRETLLPLTESPRFRSAEVAPRADAATRAGRSAPRVPAAAARVRKP